MATLLSSKYPVGKEFELTRKPLVLDVYGPLYGASAVGANNLLRYTLGGVSPLYTRQMYHALGIDVSMLLDSVYLWNVADSATSSGR